MISPMMLWFIMLIIFVLIVGIFYKIIKVLFKSILYAAVIFLVTLIVVLFFVHIDFKNFVSELDQKNYFLLEDEGELILGYQENPYNTLSKSELESINKKFLENDVKELTSDEFENLFGVKNIFIYTEEALENKEINQLIYLEEILEKNQIIARLLDDEKPLVERSELFSSVVQKWDSEFLFLQLPRRNF